MNNKKLLTLRIIFISLAVLLNAFIIYQSCLPAGKSTEWSNPIVDVVATITNMSKAEVETTTIAGHSFNDFIRKLFGHFSLYLIDGVIISLMSHYLFINKKFYFQILFAVALGIIFSSVTELIQLGVSHRSGEFGDVMINLAGFIFGGLIVFLVFGLHLYKQKALKLEE